MAESTTAQIVNLKKGKKKVGDSDLIVSTAQEVENLSEEQAYQMVASLAEDIEFNSFRLGAALSVIKLNSWFGEHGSFKGVVESKFGFTYRKAVYLTEIYECLVEHEIPWEKVAHLGWTKLRELARILNAENLDYWIAQAEKATVIQLIEMIKASKSIAEGGSNAAGENDTPIKSEVVTLSFKVHPDQKEIIRAALDKAKEETATEYDSVALERISEGYLAGAVTASTPAMDLKASMMALGDPMAVLEIFGEVFPEAEVNVSL